MTVQVTTSSSQSPQALTSQTFSYDPSSDAPPLARIGPGQLQFREILADGTLGPIWDLSDITLLSSTEDGPRLRFPDGTEIILDASPDQIAALLSEVATAAGDQGNGETIDDGGSSQAVNEPSGETGTLGSEFGDDDSDSGFDTLAGSTGGAGDGRLPEDPNLLLTAEQPGPEVLDAPPPPGPGPLALAPVPFGGFGGPVVLAPNDPASDPVDNGEVVSFSASDGGSAERVGFDAKADTLRITDVLDQGNPGLDLDDLVAAGVTVSDSGAGGDVTVSAGESSVTLLGIGTGATTDLAALDDLVNLEIAA